MNVSWTEIPTSCVQSTLLRLEEHLDLDETEDGSGAVELNMQKTPLSGFTDILWASGVCKADEKIALQTPLVQLHLSNLFPKRRFRLPGLLGKPHGAFGTKGACPILGIGRMGRCVASEAPPIHPNPAFRQT